MVNGVIWLVVGDSFLGNGGKVVSWLLLMVIKVVCVVVLLLVSVVCCICVLFSVKFVKLCLGLLMLLILSCCVVKLLKCCMRVS